MLPRVLYLGFALSMGIAIKSASGGTYLNLNTLKLEPVDKDRKNDYIFGYEWSGKAPYGFGLSTGKGYLTVNNGRLAQNTTRSNSNDFGFHFVTPVKCKNVVIGHSTGLCMKDSGEGEVGFSDCLPIGEEPASFHFTIKVFKKFSMDNKGAPNEEDLPVSGIEGLVDRIVDDIERSGSPSMGTEMIRELVKDLIRSIENPSSELKKRNEMKEKKAGETSSETEDNSEEGCQEDDEPDDETEDDSEEGCYKDSEEREKTRESESGDKKSHEKEGEGREEGQNSHQPTQYPQQPIQPYPHPHGTEAYQSQQIQNYPQPMQHQYQVPPPQFTQSYQPQHNMHAENTSPPSLKRLSEGLLNGLMREVVHMSSNNEVGSFQQNGRPQG